MKNLDNIAQQNKLQEDALYYEYSTSANPINSGLITEVPFKVFPNSLHETGLTRIIPLDMSKELNCLYPATSPALLANFVRICANENIETEANATSQLFYVIRGGGYTKINDLEIPWKKGDFFVLPANSIAIHHSNSDSAFYYVHDEPLLTYLGVKAEIQRFRPVLFTAESCKEELNKAINCEGSEEHNRLSVLLANKKFPQTRTITHVLWAMFGVVPPHNVQPPHRHQSVAIDFAVESSGNCYTLIGKKINVNNQIIDPIKANWHSGSVFITPPGYWHSHHNESDDPAYVLPMQDAGLHTYLRTLDIQFTEKKI